MHMTDKIFMEEMTWREIAEAMANGVDTVLVPLSAIEQHGPHLPTVTDTALGYERGGRIARKLGKTLVAPPIYPGVSAHHMRFPGTITVTKATFKALMRDYCHSLARHGFKKIALVPIHGGNYEALSEELPELQAALPGVNIVGIERHDSQEIRAPLNKELGIDPRVGGTHSGLTETSVMLVARPELVRMEWAEPGWLGPFDDDYLEKLRREGTHSLSEVGILGDPRGATAELGEVFLDRLSTAYADKIKEKFDELR
jgi:creatinine amidohydrolase